MLPAYQSAYLTVIINVKCNSGPPKFNGDFPTLIKVPFCQNYTLVLPPIIDPDDDQFEDPVILLGWTGLFAKLLGNILIIESIDQAFVGSYNITFIMRDLSKYPLTNKFYLTVEITENYN